MTKYNLLKAIYKILVTAHAFLTFLLCGGVMGDPAYDRHSAEAAFYVDEIIHRFLAWVIVGAIVLSLTRFSERYSPVWAMATRQSRPVEVTTAVFLQLTLGVFLIFTVIASGILSSYPGDKPSSAELHHIQILQKEANFGTLATGLGVVVLGASAFGGKLRR
jgi:hypothetical protein